MTRFNNPQKPRGMLGLGTQLADLHLPIKVNGDLAFFQAVNRRLIERGLVDPGFIDEYTDGFRGAEGPPAGTR